LKTVGLFFAIAEVISLLAKVDKWEGWRYGNPC
jgi:hypothetical protein